MAEKEEEEKKEMLNIDINEFASVQTVKDEDYLVLSLFNGTPARASVALLKSVLEVVLAPSIKDGKWFVGKKDLEVEAEGKTPELRSGELGVEYKYTTEKDDAWKLLIPYTDIKLQFDTLSKAPKDEIGAVVWEQAKTEVKEPVDKAVKDATDAATLANQAATEAEKYANRVVDVTVEQWEEMEANGTWKQGVEYNVYEV